MIELLAQGLATDVVGGAACVGGGGALVLIVQALIKKGVHAKVDVGDEKTPAVVNGKTNGKTCALHDQFALLQQERHEGHSAALARIEGRIGDVFDAVDGTGKRIDDLMKELLKKK